MTNAERDLDIGNSVPAALNTYSNSNLCPRECSPMYDRSGEASEESSHNLKELVDTFRASSVFAPRMGNARVRLYKFSEKSHPRRGISSSGRSGQTHTLDSV